MAEPEATHAFDRDYWEKHWQQASSGVAADLDGSPPNPYLMRAADNLPPGTVLDAGCGAGGEAIWLAMKGWQVTAADIAPDALALAERRAAGSGVSERVRWIEADLTVWDPGTQFDLVMTNYAHPAMPQLAFYERISAWVRPGGTLLIVGHLHTAMTGAGHHGGHGRVGHAEGDERVQGGQYGQPPPAEASVGLADVTAGLDAATWKIDTAEEHVRTLTGPGGLPVSLHDVVVSAIRRS